MYNTALEFLVKYKKIIHFKRPLHMGASAIVLNSRSLKDYNQDSSRTIPLATA